MRDAVFFAGDVPPLPEFPQMTGGLVMRRDDGSIAPGAGRLAPHVTMRSGKRVGRMDEVIGTGFLLVTTISVTLDPQLRDKLEYIGGRVATFSECEVEDLDHRIAEFLAETGWTAMLIRPDFYVYGGTTQPTGVNSMLGTFFEDTAGAGLCEPSKAMNRVSTRFIATGSRF